MKWWSRFTDAVRSFVDRVTGADPAEYARDFEPADTGRTQSDDHDWSRDEPDESRLPDGWVLVGLYHQGEKTTKIHATDDTDVTDNDIENADALIVWYEDAGEDGYRWVHGASGWDGLADYVERTVVIVSPTGRGE